MRYGFLLCISSMLALPLFASTSLSDNDIYPQFCWTAANDPRVFETFKRSPRYTGILEHVTLEQGRSYLEIVLRQTPEFVTSFHLFQENDRFGMPNIYYYDGFGTFSPTTLRYAKVASDIKKLFGSLNQQRIIEIGSGYGGQCLILSKLFAFKQYTLVDLPGPLALAKKYLGNHNVANILFKTLQDIPQAEECDLVISNYALSECNINVQLEYIRKILRRAKHGYLTMNYIGGPSLSKAEFCRILKDCGIQYVELPEEPLTAAANCLIVW